MRICDFFEDVFKKVYPQQISYNGISSHDGFFHSVLGQFIVLFTGNANYRSDDPTERVWGVAYEVSQVYEN